MPELPKIPRKFVYGGAAVLAALAVFALQDLKLRSNLKSTTRITQDLRQEVEGLRKENETFKMSELSDRTSIDKLSEQLNTLAQDKSLYERLGGEPDKMLAFVFDLHTGRALTSTVVPIELTRDWSPSISGRAPVNTVWKTATTTSRKINGPATG